MRKAKKIHSPLVSDTVKLNRAFFILAAVCTLLSMELAMVTRGAFLQDSLFWNGVYSDHFMDFFNTVRDSHDLTWVYQRNVIYPPLSVLVMYLFSLLLPQELAALSFSDRYAMQESQVAIMVYFLFSAVCVLFLAKMIDAYMKKSDVTWERYAVVFFMVVSFPLIYCLERGNLSVLALCGTGFFMLFRNSENPVVREISYIMLALSAGLKMFPAVLGVLLLYDKKYFAAGRTIVYGVLALAVPYVIVKLLTPESGGIADAVAGQVASGELTNTDGSAVSTDDSIFRFFNNLIAWTGKKNYFTYNSTSIFNIPMLLYSITLMRKDLAVSIGTALFLITEIAAFVLGFFCKKDWQKAFIACYLMLNIHTISMHYTLIYLIPVFVIFLADKDARGECRRKLDWLYMVLFSLIIVPVPNILYSLKDYFDAYMFLNLGIHATGNFNKSTSGLLFQLIFVIVLVDVIAAAVRAKKPKKEKSFVSRRRRKASAPAA